MSETGAGVAFSRVGDFHARPRFARSTIPEEKWGLLVVYMVGGVDWHRPNRKVTVLGSAFLLVDAAIFCLWALKQISLDFIALRIFSL